MTNKYNYKIVEIIISYKHFELKFKKSLYAFIWKKGVHEKAFLLSMALRNQVLAYGIENLAKNACIKS